MPDDRGPKKPPGIPVRVFERPSSRIHRDHGRRPSEPRIDAVELTDEENFENFEDEAFTDTHSIEDLPKLRATRPTGIRIAHVEKNQDEIRAEVKAIRHDMRGVKADVTGVKVAVADMGGQFKVIPQLVETMQGAIDALHRREHVTFTAKVDVDKAKEEARVELDTAEKIDDVKRRAARREWVTKGLAIVSGIAAIISTAIAAGRC